MPQVHWIMSNGDRVSDDVNVGTNLMDAAQMNGIPGVAGECGGCLSCATCHVYVDEKWTEKAGKASQMEEDMLDFAFDVKPNSRLCCQITVRPELDGLTVTTPAQQG